MAEMYLLKSEMSKVEKKEQRKSLSAKHWACFSVLRQDEDGEEVVAKSNPGFSMALCIVLTQHHLVHGETKTLEASLISTCLQSLARK